MNITLSEKTVGQLVAERPARARVFEAYRIDYCCGGGKTLEEACSRKKVSVEEVARRLQEIDQEARPDETDWQSESLTALCEHIVGTHHAYLRTELPRLSQIVSKVSRVHGEGHPELVEIHQVFQALQAELESHMMKEEQILFPLCRSLESADGPLEFHCGSVQNPIRVMVMEHDHAGSALEAMRSLSRDYTPPEDACNTYRVMLDSLRTLEQDMHQHIHKENNILFPRAVELEAGLTA